MCSQRLCTASMENSFSSLRESRTKERCSEARQRQAWLSDVISKACIVSAKGAASIRARGNAPGVRSSVKPSAESAFHSKLAVLNPRHSARQNPRHACAATRDILLETCECDGALVAPECIPAQHRVDSGSPKTCRTRVARKNRDREHRAF